MISGRKLKEKFLPLVHLKIGTCLQVELAAMEERINALYVGMEAGRFIILRLPARPDLQRRLNINNRITVRFVLSGSIYGFQTTISGQIFSPAFLILLKFPEDLEEIRLRKHQRVSCFFPATVCCSEADLDGHIIDISCGGCQIVFERDEVEIPLSIVIGIDVEAHFRILDVTGTHLVQAQVKSLDVEGKRTIMGLQFKEVDFAVEYAIESYVDKVADLFET